MYVRSPIAWAVFNMLEGRDDITGAESERDEMGPRASPCGGNTCRVTAQAHSPIYEGESVGRLAPAAILATYLALLD